jgi:hypothetical protein
MSELRPAFGAAQFFYEKELGQLLSGGRLNRFGDQSVRSEAFRNDVVHV